MGCELVTEMTVLLTESLSIADWNAHLRLNNIMTEGSQHSERDKKPWAMAKINGIYNHTFLLLECILSQRSIYYRLLSAYEFLTTLPLAICCPTASSNKLHISVHYQ
jgi:hypothetical protein